MTEYQKIENKLRPLGWKRQTCSGDHFRFTKEGNPNAIIVPFTLSKEGRAVKNMYAYIRRIEPMFPIGRQDHMLKKAAGGDIPEEEAVPEGIPWWALPGAPVRWTAAEDRNWELLDNPDSVMSHMYVVDGYKETSDGVLVVIRSALEGNGTTVCFPVGLGDIDAWELKPCAGCGRMLPENRLSVGDDDRVYCRECMDKPTSGVESREKTVAAGGSKSVTDKIADTNPLMKSTLDVLRPLKDVRICDLEPKQREIILGALKSAVSLMGSKEKKALRRDYPDAMDYLDGFDADTRVDDRMSPYEAWKKSVCDLVDMLWFHGEKTDQDAHEALRRRYFSANYTVKPLKNRKVRSKNVANVISVTTNDRDVAIGFWSASDIFLYNFSRALPGLPVFLLVNCPSAGVRQYAVPMWGDDYADLLGILEANVQKAEDACLSRARLNLLVPSVNGLAKSLKERVESHGAGVGKNTEFALEIGVRPQDGERFSEARPVFHLYVGLTGDDAGRFDDIVSDFRDGDRVDAPIDIRIADIEGGRHVTLDFTSPYTYPDGAFADDGPRDEPEGGDDDGVVLTLRRGKDGLAYVTGFDDTEENRVFLSACLCASAEEDGMYRDVYRRAISMFRNAAAERPDIKEKLDELVGDDKNTNDNPKSNNTMDKKTVLDRVNPASENPALREISTRELLKELKARGAEFQGLAITVRQEVSFDEI